MNVGVNLKQRKINQEANHLYLNPSPRRHNLFSIAIGYMKSPLTTHNRILSQNQEEVHFHAKNKRINI